MSHFQGYSHNYAHTTGHNGLHHYVPHYVAKSDYIPGHLHEGANHKTNEAVKIIFIYS